MIIFFFHYNNDMIRNIYQMLEYHVKYVTLLIYTLINILFSALRQLAETLVCYIENMLIYSVFH